MTRTQLAPASQLDPMGNGGRLASPLTFAPPSLAAQALERWEATRHLPGPDGDRAPTAHPESRDEDAARVVVGYLRTTATPSPVARFDTTGAVDPADDAVAPLVEEIAKYARDRGLTLLSVHRDDIDDDDARRPGFSACLRHLYQREASAIVIPTWEHLAPNEVLRRALCHNATSAGGTIRVIDADPVSHQ